jgi:hypothetical protein
MLILKENVMERLQKCYAEEFKRYEQALLNTKSADAFSQLDSTPEFLDGVLLGISTAMSVIDSCDDIESAVEFVSYDGRYPSLCSGTLKLKIFGKDAELTSTCFVSGGHIERDKDGFFVCQGDWEVDEAELPDELKPLRNQIERCMNDNIEHGCCGGCC